MKNSYKALQSAFILLVFVWSCFQPSCVLAQLKNGDKSHLMDEPNPTSLRSASVTFKIESQTTSILDTFNLILDLPSGATLQYNGDGVYQINNMPDSPGHYNIRIRTGGNILNGVTTADISLIQRHLLGNGNLANVYKLIAADVNCDGRVSVKDIVDIRRAILGKINKFACDTNFTFYPDSLDFEWTGVPLDLGVFIAIKLGDVNGSAAYNSESAAINGGK